VLSCLGLAAAGLNRAERPDPPPMPGQQVLIDGKRVHTVEAGTQLGGPTVVLESGLGGGSFAWAWVQPQVARFARVLSYDRAGLGWSEDDGGVHDATEVARRLHALLEQVHAPRPYVLVGHSLGGLFVLRFASLYPSEVGGLVLVDAVSPELNGQLDDYDYRHPWRVVAFGDMLVNLGLVGVFGIPPQIELLPQPARTAANYFIRSPTHWSAMLHETAAFERSLQEAREPLEGALTTGFLSDKPVIVLTATRDRPDGWIDLQRGLAKLSKREEWRVPAGTDHYGLVTDSKQAVYTVGAIRDVYRMLSYASIADGHLPRS
jgi:pimeloyl-ACP methyl ester carboxylesterase